MKRLTSFLVILAVVTTAHAQTPPPGWGEERQQDSTCNAGHVNCSTDHTAQQAQQEAYEQERRSAEAEYQKWEEAKKREEGARSKEQRDYAAWERQRCEGRINSTVNRRVSSVQRARSSGNSAKLQAELNKLKAWKQVVDKDGRLKRIVGWFSQQRMKDLEEIIGAKEAVKWLKNSYDDGTLPSMVEDWKKLQDKGHTLNDLHDEVFGNGDVKLGLRKEVDVHTAVLDELAHQQGKTISELIEDRDARLNGDSAENASFTVPSWVWWVFGGVVGVGVLVFLVLWAIKRFGGSGNNASGGQMPCPVITGVTPDTGPMTGGTKLTVDGRYFNVGVEVVFRYTGQPDLDGVNVKLTGPSQLTCDTPAFPITGDWEIAVRNTDGQLATTRFEVK